MRVAFRCQAKLLVVGETAQFVGLSAAAPFLRLLLEPLVRPWARKSELTGSVARIGPCLPEHGDDFRIREADADEVDIALASVVDIERTIAASEIASRRVASRPRRDYTLFRQFDWLAADADASGTHGKDDLMRVTPDGGVWRRRARRPTSFASCHLRCYAAKAAAEPRLQRAARASTRPVT